MKRVRLLRCVAAALAFAGIFVSQLAQAAAPRQGMPGVAIRDIALQDGGTVRGQVVNTLGVPQANSKVLIAKQGELVATAVTNGEGRFEAAGLNGGVYQVVTGEGAGAYRFWTAQTAPPAAQDEVLLIAGQDVVRGQNGVAGVLGNPWVLAGLVAAAIAIPLALDHTSGS